MSKLQEQTRLRNYKIIRLRGAYSVKFLLPIEYQQQFSDIIDKALKELGARTETENQLDRLARIKE